MKRFLSKSRKNSYRNKKRNSKKLSRKMKGGSPASTRVMGFLPNNCNSPQELQLPPVDTDISNMRLYATTGGGRKMKGGAIRMPSEYYGVDSGRYQPDANLGRSPQSYGYMNGGRRKSRRSRNIRGGSPASNRVMGFLPKQNGGAVRMPSEYYGVDSGRYQADANLGRTPNSYGYMTGGCGGMPCCSGCTCPYCLRQRTASCGCGRVGGKRKHKGGFVRDGSIQNFRGVSK